MATRSTKSNLKKTRVPSVTVQEKVREVRVEPTGPDVSERTWQISVIAIFCIAAVLRLYNLSLVPLHHDEGVNGNFLVRLVREHVYHYDPQNYHGPTLYYFAAILPWITKLLFGSAARDAYGLSTVSIRLVPALFGLGTIGLVLLLRRRLGTVATLSAAVLLAISPGAVYLSRYFIHETLFVFFTLGVIVAGLKFYDDRRPTYLLLAFVSAALLFATKETAMISGGVLFIAFVLTHGYRLIFKPARSSSRSGKKRQSQKEEGAREFIKEVGGPATLWLWVGFGLIAFITINVFFYSSFFTNYPQGVYDALKTFTFWAKTGQAQHVHPPLTYLTWLFQQESPLIILGAAGAAFAVLRSRNSLALFSALWAFGIIAAYSLVPYKTPWLALNFIVPLAIVAGYAIQSIYHLDMKQLRFVGTIMLASIAVSAYQTVDLNFFNYDNDNSYYVYVYAHTKRGTIKLVNEVDKLAQQNQRSLTGITIVSPDYWPLPWYFRNYTRVGYYGRMTQSTEPIIIASESQRAEFESTFGDRYQLVPSGEGNGSYPLRPGVDLLLYARRSGAAP